MNSLSVLYKNLGVPLRSASGRRTTGFAIASAILRRKLPPQNDPARNFEKLLRRPPYASRSVSVCRPWQTETCEFENFYRTNVVVFKLVFAWNHRRPWRF